MIKRSKIEAFGTARRMLILTSLLLGTVAVPAVVSADDDWPIRLRSGSNVDGKWHVTAENKADFPCTKLRMVISTNNGTLQGGTGPSPSKMVGGTVVFEEIPTMRPGETFKWVIDFTPAADRSTTITANLEYAEKHAPPPPKPAPKKNCQNYSPPPQSGMTASEIAFPTGSRATSALLVHQVMPVEVERNKPYVYQYYVTNISSITLQNVQLVASGFQNLAVSKSDPAGNKEGESIRWMLGDLAECETRVINVTATSASVGNASACLTATFANSLCASTKVVERHSSWSRPPRLRPFSATKWKWC
jgi:hypothetical protein